MESEVATLIFHCRLEDPATFEDTSLVRKKMSERLKMDTFKKFRNGANRGCTGAGLPPDRCSGKPEVKPEWCPRTGAGPGSGALQSG